MASAVRALGEVALRVNDLERSQAFYADVIGLPLLRRFERSAFFRIAEGHAGHTAILALFDRSVKVEQERSTVDHIAFTIERSDYGAEKERLESLGHSVRTAVHEWVQWRSLYVRDPDGNEVELVCYDPAASRDCQAGGMRQVVDLQEGGQGGRQGTEPDARRHSR